MSFQFIHTECYSRKADKDGRSVSWILDEVERHPLACSHIENPEMPTIVYGTTVADLRCAHEAVAARATVTTVTGHTRAISSTQKTLLTIVASHPFTPQEVREVDDNLAQYVEWETDTVEWLKNEFGAEFKLAVRHMDESRMHIHAYVLPSDSKANELHPGARAKRCATDEALKQGVARREGDEIGDVAYKEAMAQWQQRYFTGVSEKHGFSAEGPGRKRLTRGEWYQAKIAAKFAQLDAR